MSRLVTQLVADEPAVVLVGKNTILRKEIAVLLKNKNVAVDIVDPKNITQEKNKLQEAYKVVWVKDGNLNPEEYLEELQAMSKVKSQLAVVLPIFSGIEESKSDLLKKWVLDTQTQLQLIVDFNYYLPNASFIFGENIIGNNKDISAFNYILLALENNVVYDVINDIKILSINDFVQEVVDFIFIPKKQISVLIKGKETNSTNFVSLLKKLYDAYHNTNLEIIQDKVTFTKVVPFSVSERQVITDNRVIATHLVKNLKSPSLNKEETKIFIPEPRVNIENQAVETKFKVPLKAQPKVEHRVIPQRSSGSATNKNQFLVKETLLKQKIEKKPQLEFSPQVKPPEIIPEKTIYSESADRFSIKNTKKDKVDLNKEIKRIFKDSRTEQKVERIEKIVKSTKKITKKSKRRTKLFYGGLLSVGMAVGMIVLALVYVASGAILKKQVVGFLNTTSENKNLTKLPSSALLTTTSFVASQTDLYGQIIELNSISQNSVLVSLIQQFKNIPIILFQADQASKNLVLNILNGNIGNTTELTETLTQNVSEAYEKLSLIQATLGQIDLGEHSEQQQSVVDQIHKEIKEIRSGLEVHQQLQQVLQDMVGINGKRTYALLLQNNQELRPTGGFIQAVALLNFDDGSLVSYQVYSVYDLDKKLPGQVIPPDDIKNFLGEKNWYLRDGNWNPDFPKTSKQIAWFIQKSLGVNVDGVIAMNVFSLADLIKAVGPIDLSEYNEVITHKNIEERMEFHSEVVLVDSPESIDYSVKILTETLDHLVALKEESVPVLLKSLENSLETKQTLIYSSTESEQSILQTLGWTGSLTPPLCPSRLSVVDCLVDNIAQVEANIGINKANYYLDRTIDHKIVVSKTSAQHRRTVTFNNKSQSNSWPKGTYKSYIRFFVNSNSQLEKVLINGSELLKNQVIETQEDGFKVLGIRVDVPIQKQLELELVYSTPLTTEESFSYVFYNKKQSGLDSDPFNVSITHTPDLKPVLVAPSAIINGNTINFSAQFLDDASLFGVRFE